MAKKNNSSGKPYYTQRNNTIKPLSSCMTTAMINALSAAGYDVEKLATKKDVQSEDALLRFIMTDAAVDAQWKMLDPLGRYPPNEWHEVLSYGTNRFCLIQGLVEPDKVSRGVCAYTESIGRDAITTLLDSGAALVVSGAFPMNDGKILNHAVSVVGYEHEKGTEITELVFILDDPYGDYTTGYKNTNGNDVRMPYTDWNRIIKECGKEKKRAHVVVRA